LTHCPPKKFCLEVIFLHIFIGIFEKDKEKTEIAFKTGLRRTIRSPRLTYLCPRELSFLLKETNKGSQVDKFIGFTPTYRPKYLNGRLP